MKMIIKDEYDEREKDLNEAREILELHVTIRDLLKRVLLLEEFIRNGVKNGNITVPDKSVHDPTLDTTIDEIMGVVI
jgi:hypothetical protein